MRKLEIQTGLSPKEQRAARNRLVKLGILRFRYDRNGHATFFTLDLARLTELVGACAQREHAHVTSGDVATSDSDADPKDSDKEDSEN